jgi:uncharacterized glyoxalase superfamily protein PhnB
MSSKTTPIPEGFHTITPSLIVNDAASALEFYKSALGAEVLIRMPTPDGSKIMHSSLRVGNSIFFVTDEFPGMSQKSATSLGGTAVSLNLYVDDADAAFDRAVQAGATVLMPVAEMFWGDRFGTVADPFGHVWSFATQVKQPTLEEVMEGAKAAFGSAET